MTWYIEHRRTVERTGPLKYVPLEACPTLTGFRAVYAVDAALKDHILKAGSVSGLDGVPVYSDTLFLDYDGEDGVEAARDTLCGLGARFEIYTTGRRGRHFHVQIEPMFGTSVPYSQLQFVRAYFTGAFDHTIYRPHSIIRLPGTYHEKAPGQMKQRLELLEGNPLRIPMQERPPEVAVRRNSEETQNPSDFWTAVLSPKATGRTFRLFFLGALAARCGIDYEEGLAAARSWATTICYPPLTSEREIQRVFSNGYERGDT
jgi:hypothetical protein